MSYSLAELTQKMSGTSVTLGWDAVVFMNRAKVNSLLEQQYITRFNRDSFMKSITGVAVVTHDGDEVLEISGLILSQPRLSFETASLRNSRVTATLDIVSGTVTYVRKGSNSAPGSVVYSYVVTANQGYTLTMDIDLTASKGTVNEQGKVIVDIGESYNCRCDLVREKSSQELLGKFFKDLYMEQKPEDRVYELGALDLRDVDLLAPRSFIIRTMAAEPGALRNSDGYGEGAVVLLVRTKGNPEEGESPMEGSFDYLIPNDVDPTTKKAKYSGAVVLASRAVFDWYFQYPIQNMLGHGTIFERLHEGDTVAGSLKAVSGALPLPGYHHRWHNSPGLIEEVASVGEHKLPFYNPVSGKALRITSTSDGALSLVWHLGTIKQPFSVHTWDLVGGIKDYDSDGEVTGDVSVLFDPVVDPADNTVLFKVRELAANFSLNYQPVIESYTNIEFHDAFYDNCIPVVQDQLNKYSNFFQDASSFYNFGIPEINALAISNLLFPEKNALQLTDARLPGDLLMVGQIDPKETTFTLSPLLPVIKAGETITFDIVQLARKSTQVNWSVRSVDGARALGTIDNGTYTAPAVHLLEGSASRNVITATYIDEMTGKEVTASALVTVVMVGVVVTPAISLIDMSEPETVALKASTLGAGSLKWTLRDDIGSLVVEGSEAIYTPPTMNMPDNTLQAVLIDVEDTITGDKALATVLFRQGFYSLDISPAIHPGLRSSNSALLKVSGDDEPATYKWEVVVGEGEVDPATGVFTAPSVISLPYSVVKITLEEEFFDNYGYSVIHLSDHARQSQWFEMDVFLFEVTEMPPTVYANGLQQARVVVRARPTDVDGKEVMLSDAEFASICLVSADEHNPLPQVGAGGVPKDGKWHYTEVADVLYDPYPRPGLASPVAVNNHSAKAVQVKEFYVQCHKIEDLRIAAMLISDSYKPFYSNSSPNDGEADKKVINLVAKEPPQGGTVGGVILTFGNPGEWPVRMEGGQDDDDLSSLDYYYLKLKIHDVQKKIKRVEFHGNTSMVKWESNTTLEDVHSITGYSFGDQKNEQGETILHYDEILLRRIDGQVQPPRLTLVNGLNVPDGQVLFSVQRREYWQYDRYMKADFDRPLDINVYDNYGNKHPVQIGFEGTNRNRLKIVG